MGNLESLSRARIQSLRTLRKRADRRTQRLFLVEGHRAVMQVLRNGVLQVRSLIVTTGYLEMMRGKEPGFVQSLLSGSNGRVFRAGEKIVRQLVDTDSVQGILAVCHLPEPVPASKLFERSGVLLAADRIRDPGNLGTMIRTAVWFGLKGIVLSEGTADLFQPKVVRSTAGATGVLPWLETSLTSFLEQASDRGWKVHLLDSGRGSVSHLSAQPSGRDILVAGSEAGGLSDEIRDAGYPRMRIDPAGQAEKETSEPAVESLNASVASAIVMARFCLPRSEPSSLR